MKNKILCNLACLFLFPSFLFAQMNIFICKEGKPACTIVYPNKANSLEKLAAKEVAKYLGNITTTEYKVINTKQSKQLKTPSTFIVLSTAEHIKEWDKNISFPDTLKDTGYIIRSITNVQNPIIFIAGKTGKGVLNGAYGFIEEILRKESGKKFVDIDFNLERKLPTLSIPPLNIIDNPYSSVMGMELDGFGLDNKSLLNPATSEYMVNCWKNLVNWCRRHKVNFITNWPYGGESMNDFPNIVILDRKKYPKAVSPFTDDEIRKAAKIRRECLQYASDNGVDPYLMTYVPGWYTTTIRKNYPAYCGEGSHGDSDGFGSRAFDWGNNDFHTFLADLTEAVVKQYPEAKGLHFRVWGGESAPDVANKHRKAELIQKMIKRMVTSAVDTRENIKFVISEYTEFGDKDLTYLPQLKALSPNIIIHRKWDEDWGVSNNPRIPKAPAWLNTNDGVKRGVSMSIPNEEAIPLWFPTVRFYQEGMLKYLKKGEETINGWPVNYRDWHTDNCDNTLNLTAVMKLSWDPFDFDYKRYYEDSFYFLFGKESGPIAARAANLSSEALCDFLYDYGGIVDGMDSKNYLNITKALIGKPGKSRYGKYVGHILEKESRPEDLLNIKVRIARVLPMQEEAVRLLRSITDKVTGNREMFENMLNVNEAWLYLLKSRIAAVDFVLNKDNDPNSKKYLEEFLHLEDMLAEKVNLLTNTSAQSMFDKTEDIKNGFIRQIRQEQEYMRKTYLK